MKKQISFLLLFSIATGIFAQKTELFFEGTWEQARIKAKKENKYVFLDCWSEGCGYCKMMDQETFSDSSVVSYMESKFVAVSRDMYSGEGILLNMKYHIRGFPSFLIFNPQGQLCFEFTGYMKPNEFIDSLESALNPKKQFVCKGFSYELEPGYPDFYKRAFGYYGDPVIADSTIVMAWLDKQNDWTSEICWSVLWQFCGGAKHQRWILNNQEQLIPLYGNEVPELASGLIGYYCHLANIAKSDSLFLETLEMAKTFLKEPYRSERINSNSRYYYKATENWINYGTALEEIFEKDNFKSHDGINDECWTLAENCTDTATLNKAIGWIQIVLISDSTSQFIDTYAMLLYKTNRLQEAETYALQAIEKGKLEGVPTIDSENLLDQIRHKSK